MKHEEDINRKFAICSDCHNLHTRKGGSQDRVSRQKQVFVKILVYISGRPQLSAMLINYLSDSSLPIPMCFGGEGAGYDSFILKDLVMNLIQSKILYIRETLRNSFIEGDKCKGLLFKTIVTVHSLARSCGLLVECRQSPQTMGSFCGRYYP